MFQPKEETPKTNKSKKKSKKKTRKKKHHHYSHLVDSESRFAVWLGFFS